MEASFKTGQQRLLLNHTSDNFGLRNTISIVNNWAFAITNFNCPVFQPLPALAQMDLSHQEHKQYHLLPCLP